MKDQPMIQISLNTVNQLHDSLERILTLADLIDAVGMLAHPDRIRRETISTTAIMIGTEATLIRDLISMKNPG